MAPNLTHFRCSEMYSNGIVAADLEAVLGLETGDKQRPEGLHTTFRLPSTVTTIVVQAAARQYHGLIFRIYSRGGVIVFPPDDESGKQMEAEWLDRIHGGQGCWCENNG
jgi:hypothetical protein